MKSISGMVKRPIVLCIALLSISLFVISASRVDDQPLENTSSTSALLLPGSSNVADVDASAEQQSLDRVLLPSLKSSQHIPSTDAQAEAPSTEANLQVAMIDRGQGTDSVIAQPESTDVELVDVANLPIESAEPTVVPTPLAADDWFPVNVEKGDTLSSIFDELHVHSALGNLLEVDEAKKELTRIRPGEEMRVRIQDGKLAELIYEPSKTRYLHIIQDADGSFSAETVKRDIEIREQRKSGLIEYSLFGSAAKAGVSDKLIMEMAEIFSFDIDFALDIRQGDQFSVIFEERYVDGDALGVGDILAAEFTNQGRTYYAFRYEGKDGEMSYYDQDGRALEKAFHRSPVKFARISSHFNPKRLHPILHTIRAHKGVDYAASTGTPIHTTGSGKIVFRGTKGGYGNTIVIQHGEKYSTLYAHMSKFKSGLSVGSKVKQDDVIGYVGSTGRSTGPHLHYEFRVNGVHKNPLTVDLPKSRQLPASEIANFKQLMTPYLAQLELMKTNQMLSLDTTSGVIEESSAQN